MCCTELIILSADSSKKGSVITHLHTLGVYQGVRNKTQIIIVVFK